jgi:septal ring factor EnvC (AmiA/AmiB activator)
MREGMPMPTVRSLEERIDDMAADVADLKGQMTGVGARMDVVAAQLATVVSTLGATHAQLAVVAARLESASDGLNATNARLEAIATRLDSRLDAVAAKIEGHGTEFAAFRGKAETTLNLTKWIGAFTAGVLVTVGGSAVMAARYVGTLEASVQHQQRTLDEIKRDLGDIRSKLKP